MADGSILIETKLDRKDLESGIKNIEKDLKKLKSPALQLTKSLGEGFKKIGSSVTALGKTLTTSLTIPIAALTTAGLKYNMEMENYLTNLTVLLQGNEKEAQKVLSTLKEMAKTTPFETSDLVKATQTMMSFGITSQKAQTYLKQLGDISMGDANKLSSLTLAFSQISSTGKLMGQDLLQMINAGFNPLNVISQKTGKSMSQLKDEMSKGQISAEQVAQALEWATEEGGLFYQGMDKGSKTLKGRISTLKDAFKEMIGTLTESFLPTLEKVVDGLTIAINKVSNLSPEMKDSIAKIVLGIGALGPIMLVVGKAFSFIGGALSNVAGIILKVKETGGIASALGVSSTTLGHIGLIIASITIVISFFTTLYKLSEKLRKSISGLIEKIKGKFEELKENLEPAFERIKTAVEKNLPKIKVALTELGDAIGQNITTATPFIDILGGIFSALITVASYILSVVIPVITQLIVWFINWHTMLINIKGAILEFASSIKKAFDSAKETVTTALAIFQKTPSEIARILQLTLSNIITFGNNFISRARDIATNVFNAIINTLNELPGKVIEIGKNIVEGIWQGIQNATGWLHDKITSFSNGILDSIKIPLKIESPSKVFRDEVGKNIALGIGVGFTKNIGKVYNQMKSAVDFETQKLNANLTTTNNKLITINTNFNGNVEMDSKKVGRLLAPSISKTIRTAGV